MATRTEAHGLTAEVNAKLAAKYDLEIEQQVRKWAEAVAGRPIVADVPADEPLGAAKLQEALKDGVFLCDLINGLEAGSAPKPRQSKIAFMQMENIGNFLKGCEKYGLKAQDTFQTADLYDNTNILAVVTTLYSLGRKAQAKGYTGASLGPRESTAQ